MRDLTDKELDLIAGGNTVSNAASIDGAVGGAAGASYALSILRKKDSNAQPIDYVI